MKTNERFNHFIGPFVFGKSVAVYGHGETRTLIPETCGGKELHRTHRPIVFSADEYEGLRETWSKDCLSRDDARITERALQYLAKPGDNV